MLKKKKGNNPSSNTSVSVVATSTGNHSSSSSSSAGSKIRSPAVIPPMAEIDSGGFDETGAGGGSTACGSKSQIYSTTV